MVVNTLRDSVGALAGQLGSLVPDQLVDAADTAVRTLPGGDAIAAVGREMAQPDRVIEAAQVLVGAGVIRLDRPDDALRAARVLLDRKMTPAAGFVVSAIRYPDETAIVFLEDEHPPGSIEEGLLEHRRP